MVTDGPTGDKGELQAALHEAFSRYSATGSLTELEECIAAYERFIPTLDETKVEHGNAVLDLAQLLGDRWALTRSEADWNEAEARIDAFRRRIPQSDWREPLYALAQGALLYRRADKTEAPQDIAAALNRLQKARAKVRPAPLSIASAPYTWAICGCGDSRPSTIQLTSRPRSRTPVWRSPRNTRCRLTTFKLP